MDKSPLKDLACKVLAQKLKEMRVAYPPQPRKWSVFAVAMFATCRSPLPMRPPPRGVGGILLASALPTVVKSRKCVYDVEKKIEQ